MLDTLKIYCVSGKGGNGHVHFKSSKFNFKGGPDGGNGGAGGSIILLADKCIQNIYHLKNYSFLKAQDGYNGLVNCKQGKRGKDIIVKLPINTIVRDINNKVICHIISDKQSCTILKGGAGGYGNAHFKSSIFKSPLKFTRGKKGEQGCIIFEFQLLSDVAIIGAPNVGKSTLLSVITSAKPKIGNYAFTSLFINLGIMRISNNNTYLNKSIIISDVPGIIKGASSGKGLGLQFLRHLIKNRILLLVIPIDNHNPVAYLNTLITELYLYNSKLLNKHIILLITKCDLFDLSYQKLFISKIKTSYRIIFISSLTGYGIEDLITQIFDIFNNK